MKIIITESQSRILWLRRRLEDERLQDDMEVIFFDIMDNIYDRVDEDYGVEKCWGDEYWDEFSAPIKRFISSRYEAKLKEHFENHYN
jgi:hypothetical protein